MFPDHDKGDNPDAGDVALRQKLKNLLFFRLLLAVFFLLLTLAVQSRRQGELLGAHLQPLYLFSCILFLFTIFAAVTLKRARHLEKFGYLQIFFDVAAVTFLIYLSGGIESLFAFLYTPVIISAALLFQRRGCFLTASACSLAYGLLLDLQYFGLISPLQVIAQTIHVRDSGTYFHTILMSIAGFYLVAFLCGYLAEELQKSSRQVRKQEDDLYRLGLLHRNIVQSVNSGLLTISPTGYVVFCNRAAEEVLALRPDQILGHRLEDIFPSLDGRKEGEKASFLPHISPSTLCRKEIIYRRPMGETLCLGYTVTVLHEENVDNGGREGEGASGWIFIFQDLTNLKGMEEHVRRMERLAFAGKIAAEIAHEIKNPLASMSGAVQMLQGQIDHGSLQSRLIGIVDREIDRINELVTDFLWLARGARKPERIEKVDACTIIQEVLTLLKTRDKITSDHQVRTDFGCASALMMDPHHFRQILWNLLVNAVEAMPRGGEVFIRVRSLPIIGSDAEEVRIDVRDMGSGISEDFRDRVFDPFFTTKQNGTGLGLSIVYQLVENAGGRVDVSHHDGHGTTFSLFFPTSPDFPLAN